MSPTRRDPVGVGQTQTPPGRPRVLADVQAMAREHAPAVTQRRPGNPNWVKGSASPNPGGRPRVIGDIQTLARQHAPAAIQALAEALRDPRTKVAAATALLDRGYGRPVAMIAGDRELPLQIDFRWADAADTAPKAAEQVVRRAIAGSADEGEATEVSWDTKARRLPN